MTKKLTSAEMQLVADLLAETSDEYADHGCNDYEIPNTKENKTLLVDMIEWSGGDEEEIEQVRECRTKNIYTSDWMLMDYLAHRCQESIAKGRE